MVGTFAWHMECAEDVDEGIVFHKGIKTRDALDSPSCVTQNNVGTAVARKCAVMRTSW